ncbi:MAG: PrsW family intramembrane metalloprotease [Spirochaetes bacterium]|nr:PrsW family intramembrane metalloprotease [Spirochaetota bacterium]
MTEILKITISFIMAVTPAIFLVKYFYGKDSAKPEPASQIIKIFILGIISTIPIIIIEYVFQYLSFLFDKSPLAAVFINAFIIAALSEETFKFLIVRIFIYNKPFFDEEVDGIIYCVVAGLGFACMENILYVMNSGIGVALIRAFTAIPLHALAAGIMGYYIGKAKFSATAGERNLYFIKGLAAAILIHGIYDFVLMGAPLLEKNFGALISLLSVFLLIPFLLITFFMLKKDIKTAIRHDRENNRI